MATLEARPRLVLQRRSRTARARRVAMLAAALALVPVIVSYVSAMAQPSNASLGIRSVEWLRDHGARGLVNRVESIYYSLQAPSTGGPALRALPHLPGQAVPARAAASPALASAARAAAVAARALAYRPPAIAPLIRPALPGEGVWRQTFGRAGHRPPPVLVTSFRSDPAYPTMVAGVAWINHLDTSTWLYPGRLEPAVALRSRGPMEVPLEMRGRLVAAFNSGFKLSDAGGGLTEGGHTYAPLKAGLATLVRYRSGRVDVIGWSGGSVAGADVIYARQNLPLIVDHRRPNPNLSDGPEWGATLGNKVRVWRSAVGVDRHRNLIYAAADYQTVGSLAAIMIHAGAVRAMELDINAYWPSFITYRRPGAAGAANLLPGMTRSRARYLTPDDRDFFAVYLR